MHSSCPDRDETVAERGRGASSGFPRQHTLNLVGEGTGDLLAWNGRAGACAQETGQFTGRASGGFSEAVTDQSEPAASGPRRPVHHRCRGCRQAIVLSSRSRTWRAAETRREARMRAEWEERWARDRGGREAGVWAARGHDSGSTAGEDGGISTGDRRGRAEDALGWLLWGGSAAARRGGFRGSASAAKKKRTGPFSLRCCEAHGPGACDSPKTRRDTKTGGRGRRRSRALSGRTTEARRWSCMVYWTGMLESGMGWEREDSVQAGRAVYYRARYGWLWLWGGLPFQASGQRGRRGRNGCWAKEAAWGPEGANGR